MGFFGFGKKRRPTPEPQEASLRRLEPEQLKVLMIASSLAYGLQPTQDGLRLVQNGYEHFAARVPLAERRETVFALCQKIEGGLSSARSLEPLIHYDPAHGVVATATLYLAALMPLRNGDELTGPKHVCQLVRSARTDQSRGQMVAGLLLLGDRRVMPMVRECFGLLGADGRKELASAWSGVAHQAVVEFMLEWLEEAVDREDEFGLVAGTLARTAIQAQPRAVLDVRRVFGTATTDVAAIEVLERWEIPAYGRIIAPRLRALEARERAPKITPLVMHAWGIQ